jgi:nucleoid DNA-binding protein
VKAVVEGIMDVAAAELKKNGSFKLAGALNMKLKKKPARPARKGVNPFTKEPCVFKAKPASKTVRALPMKKLKGAWERATDSIVICSSLGGHQLSLIPATVSRGDCLQADLEGNGVFGSHNAEARPNDNFECTEDQSRSLTLLRVVFEMRHLPWMLDRRRCRHPLRLCRLPQVLQWPQTGGLVAWAWQTTFGCTPQSVFPLRMLLMTKTLTFGLLKGA